MQKQTTLFQSWKNNEINAKLVKMTITFKKKCEWFYNVLLF